MSIMKHVIIIGAGISGLAAGWVQKRAGNHVTILEKSNRVGGWIHSINENGFFFEQGPRGFRPVDHGKATLTLVKELGLEKNLIQADPRMRKKYIVINKKLCAVTPPLLLKNGLLKAILKDLITATSDKDDETILEFCSRRFSKKLAHLLADPITKGLFGGDINALSMRSCFPKIWEAEKSGSVILNMRKFYEKTTLLTFREGMQILPNRLFETLHSHILLNTPVVRIEKNRVILADKILEADKIIVAIPAHELAKITNIKDTFSYTSLTVVCLGWSKALLPKRGYGFLVPSREEEPFLGMTWDSNLFKEHNKNEETRICVMIRGDGEIETAIMAAKKYLGIVEKPDIILIKKAEKAFPQYLLGHHKRLDNLKKEFSWPLIGSSYTGSSVNDCIYAAYQL